MVEPSPEPNRPLTERIFRDAQFIASLGVELDDLGWAWCESHLLVMPTHRQQHGIIHAGVLMAIADHTCGGAAATTMPAGKDVVTVETKVSFLRPASGERVTCRAEVLRTGTRLVFAEAQVWVDRDGGRMLVAKGSSTLAIVPLMVRH